jgi:hypothetical protein
MLKLNLGFQKWGVENLLPIFFISICFLISWQFQKPQPHKPDRSVRVTLNPEIALHLALGQRLISADFAWLRVIQDFDFKESGVINKGWVYRTLDLVTTFDSRFRMPYINGAPTLSVLVHDKEGARLIFEKGIKNFPQDWSLLYRASYHYLYEVHDCKRAAELLNEAGKYGAPKWVANLASKLYTKTGQHQLARTVLVDIIERVKGTDFEEKFIQRLKDLDEKSAEGYIGKSGEIIDQCSAL